MNLSIRRNLSFLSIRPGEAIHKPLFPVKDDRTQGDKILDTYDVISMPEEIYIASSLGIPSIRLADVLRKETLDYIVMVIKHEFDNI